MYAEYITDISILCEKAHLSREESDALIKFAMNNSDSMQEKAEGPLMQKAIRKLKEAMLYLELKKYISTPKTWDADYN